MSMSDKSLAAVLDISTHPRVAGEVVNGHVNFDLARAQEENIYQIQVELMGVISTYADDLPQKCSPACTRSFIFLGRLVS
jgi:hypothetical protein